MTMRHLQSSAESIDAQALAGRLACAERVANPDRESERQGSGQADEAPQAWFWCLMAVSRRVPPGNGHPGGCDEKGNQPRAAEDLRRARRGGARDGIVLDRPVIDAVSRGDRDRYSGGPD